ncbi:hypothetical protein P7C73_g1171, partial [Tremellales sp. Uapishka_1]
MNRYRSAPVLSPSTAKALIESFANEGSGLSSSSDSPDSLYSNGSPTFPDQAFEFDVENHTVESVEEEEYDEQGASWASPVWGRWPETLTAAPGWSPSPKNSPRKASIISISPRGSVSDRRSSMPWARVSEAGRRDSDPTLLGFDLVNQRRRSSGRSLTSSRRRSSAFSNGSSIDQVEDAQLRHIASMDGLARRFSEVVEVTCASDSEAEDTAVARARFSQWSPDSDSEDDSDISEVHTAPSFPTPVLARAPPVVLSNFPLTSVAIENPLNTPSENSTAPSPVTYSFTDPTSRRFISTPSPPMAPSTMLRTRARPSVARTLTDFQFPARSVGVPLGAAPPRPTLHRAVSTPFFSVTARDRQAAALLEDRAIALFPGPGVPAPLGSSPLREMNRRASALSEGDSRRPSLAASVKMTSSRRSSTDTRRSSTDIRRASLVTRRKESTTSRRSSLAPDSRRSSKDTRRSSNASRKSSWVDSSEFAYLAPQIVIDAAPTVETPRKLRPNAPTGFALPSFTFHPSTAPSTPYTPRFNPMESFLGTASPPSSMAPLSPSTEWDHATPTPRTPTGGAKVTGVLNRGRPVTSPEFQDSFPTRPRAPPSPKSNPQSTETPGSRSILRKPVPHMILDEPAVRADPSFAKDMEMARTFERRGATLFTDDEQILLRHSHRRTTSGVTPSPKRPAKTRQTTLPVELDQVRPTRPSQISLNPRRPISVEPETSMRSNNCHPSSEETAPPKMTKQVSVTFSPPTRPAVNRASSSSSFSRFFPGRSRSNATPSTTERLPSAMRPTSVDSSTSEKTMVDMRELLKKIGSSPKRTDAAEGQRSVAQ